MGCVDLSKQISESIQVCARFLGTEHTKNRMWPRLQSADNYLTFITQDIIGLDQISQ